MLRAVVVAEVAKARAVARNACTVDEIVHARIENMILVVQPLENLVPRLLRVGKLRIVAHHDLKLRPSDFDETELYIRYAVRPSFLSLFLIAGAVSQPAPSK